ncbi:MAG: SpoIID/LytB domain-containing protein [Candidatus Omnitrophica bacterium]|nr:SpoIID/LytB domain-containing protein [Candidatus Omnitrophota bacterium]
MIRTRFYSLFFVVALSLWPFSGDREKEIKPSSMEIPSQVDQFQVMRILLFKEKAGGVVIQTDDPFMVLDREGRVLLKGENLAPTAVKTDLRGVQIGVQVFRNAPIFFQSLGEGVHIENKSYRDTLAFWPDPPDKLTVVNHLDMSDYLKGVLPFEIDPKWKMETLKAQAVASRTFALFRALENQYERYDVTAGVMSQVYAGKVVEHPSTDQAVEATRGEILTFQGKIFPAFFHSTCGGATTAAHDVWPIESHPALQSVRCDVCRASKHFYWKSDFSLSEIEKKLNEKGYSVSGVFNFAPVDYDSSGRGRFFVIEYSGGKLKIKSDEFRLMMDPSKFRSTLIKSWDIREGHLYLEGQGWGHGVGMCQYGAKRLGELGYTYLQILDYYYPRADITVVW